MEVVQTLLAAQADTKCTDKDGRTPLHKSCERGCVQVTATLIEAGADTAVQDTVRESDAPNCSLQHVSTP